MPGKVVIVKFDNGSGKPVNCKFYGITRYQALLEALADCEVARAMVNNHLEPWHIAKDKVLG